MSIDYYNKYLPISNNTIKIEGQSLQIEQIAAGNIILTYRIVSPETFIVKGNVYNSNGWVVKTPNSVSASKTFKLFETADKTAAALQENLITIPDTLISPSTYGHPTDGYFWVVRNIPYAVDPNLPLSEDVVDFVKTIFKMNCASEEILIKLIPENIRVDVNGCPYFTGTTRAIEAKVHTLIKTIHRFPTMQCVLAQELEPTPQTVNRKRTADNDRCK